MIKEISSEDLRVLAKWAYNHCEFVKRAEGKDFPAKDERIRQLALEIVAAMPKTQFTILNG